MEVKVVLRIKEYLTSDTMDLNAMIPVDMSPKCIS
jgi:hypothetical protein